MPVDHREWAGPDGKLGRHILAESQKTLGAYRSKETLVQRDANEEADIARGGYAHRQLFELVQNGADAATKISDGGRIDIILTESHLYCADNGLPIDEAGVTALELSHMSPKRDTNEIGRFGLGFKSVLGVSRAPEFFSLAGSFSFDPDRARRRILSVVPEAESCPTLSLPEPIDPRPHRAGDPVLADLMTWASNIVRLPLMSKTKSSLSTQIGNFPGEFLLFVKHLRSLSLTDRVTGASRHLRVRRRGDHHILSDGGSTSSWRVFSRRHRLSRAAQEDNRSLDNAAECTIRWAAPLGRSNDQGSSGYFWAFFPTKTASLLSGILNAPWKTNEDRQNLLPGAYNDELIEASAGLIAENLHKLSTPDDPAKHLDALPRREAPREFEQSKLLRTKLFSEVSRRSVVPDQEGVLRRLWRVKYPPRELAKGGDRAPLARWSEYEGRPLNWLHTRAMTPGRLARIDQLFEARPWPLQSPAVSGATIADWLEALVKGCPQGEVAEASMAAVQVAAALLGKTKSRKPADFGRIVLAADGELQLPDPEAIFLTDTENSRTSALTGKSEVHPDLTRNIATNEALGILGIVTASTKSRFAVFVKGIVEHFSETYTYPEGTWDEFWRQSRQLSVADALEIIGRKRQGKIPFVKTLTGTWFPADSVLLPGEVVEVDGTDEQDRRVTVDTRYHDEDRALLAGLNISPGPQENRDLSTEPWFRAFRNACRARFRRQAIEAAGSRPQESHVVFDSEFGSGPVYLLRRLSGSAAARYTSALLDFQSTYQPWVVRHRTQAKYPPLEQESPVLDHLRRYGWVETSVGPVQLEDALGPRPKSKPALYALLAHPNAEKIKNAFELAEPQPVFAGASEPVPLVDVWPGLQEHLRDDQEHMSLCRCEHIGVAGQDRRCILHGGDLYLTAQVEDESDQLRLVTDRLALRISPSELNSILERRTRQEVEQRRAAIRRIATNAQRLLETVAESNLRLGLGPSALTILERDDGPLSGEQVARAVIATHHTDSLRQFKWALDHLDPPKQWAGSSAAVRFVRSLGFPVEWAGQRGRRREAYIEVNGRFELPPLHGYQQTIVDNVRSLLRGEADSDSKRRGMISLPTGSGKTRVAVQALVDAMRLDEFKGGILWIADRDELCEQAVESWAQVWASIGLPREMRISRMWGGQRRPERITGPHVVVATIQTLHASIKAGHHTGDSFLDDIGIVVFDEAHRSIAPTFTSVTRELGLTSWQRTNEPFMIGLTATPYRGYNEAETEWLARRYASNRLDEGAFVSSDSEYVVQKLQADDVLAKVDHATIEGAEFSLQAHELTKVENVPWLPRSAEKRLASDSDRTRRILRAYEKHIPGDWPTLIFATSVEHAGALAALLGAKGIRARAVSGNTEMSTRRRVVDAFRAGEIQALVNYAVFREGFDAPRTRAIVVARPVYSPNLYFQMIGRGMRGIKNGGNDRCLILNVEDNITNFNQALAFTELDWLWVDRG